MTSRANAKPLFGRNARFGNYLEHRREKGIKRAAQNAVIRARRKQVKEARA